MSEFHRPARTAAIASSSCAIYPLLPDAAAGGSAGKYANGPTRNDCCTSRVVE